MDYIVIGSDGIFDKLSNEELVRCGWVGLGGIEDPMVCYKQAVDNIMAQSLIKKTQDNISAVLIAFKNLENLTKNSYDYNLDMIVEDFDESELVDQGLEGHGYSDNKNLMGENSNAMDLEEIDGSAYTKAMMVDDDGCMVNPAV